MDLKSAHSVNRIFEFMEKLNFIEHTSAFLNDYHTVYPELKNLEQYYPTIRKECETLLIDHARITNMEDLLTYTKGGIHAIKWKSYLLKLGDEMIVQNCERCPVVAGLLEKIPRVRNALFSILEGQQYISPHWGYYHGYLRYHLGVITPNNNADQNCWLRVCSNDQYNCLRYQKKMNYDTSTHKDLYRSLLDQYGQQYFWKDGEGCVFNDNYLHDAANSSQQIRVVLFLDLDRPLPKIPNAFNQFLQSQLYRTKMVKQARKNVIV